MFPYVLLSSNFAVFPNVFFFLSQDVADDWCMFQSRFLPVGIFLFPIESCAENILQLSCFH